ncbi:recombinase family protein [Embleya sp. NPDC005575]|uniref:recombinase family protein n=1 Tax=Embleya sp. NPDC005575 TaxID=3156892 RepID=UPI0033BA4D71
MWTELPRPAGAGVEPVGHERLGYARASTARQSLDSRLDCLAEHGVARVFPEKISTRATKRPELDKAVGLARELRGSGVRVTLVVHEHKRPGRGIEWTSHRRIGSGGSPVGSPGTGSAASVGPPVGCAGVGSSGCGCGVRMASGSCRYGRDHGGPTHRARPGPSLGRCPAEPRGGQSSQRWSRTIGKRAHRAPRPRRLPTAIAARAIREMA